MMCLGNDFSWCGVFIDLMWPVVLHVKPAEIIETNLKQCRSIARKKIRFCPTVLFWTMLVAPSYAVNGSRKGLWRNWNRREIKSHALKTSLQWVPANVLHTMLSEMCHNVHFDSHIPRKHLAIYQSYHPFQFVMCHFHPWTTADPCYFEMNWNEFKCWPIHIVQTHTHTHWLLPQSLATFCELLHCFHLANERDSATQVLNSRPIFLPMGCHILWCPTTRRKFRINTTQNFQCWHRTCPRDSCVWAGGLRSRRHERGPVWRQEIQVQNTSS